MEQCRAFQEKIPWKQLGTAWLSAVQSFSVSFPFTFTLHFSPSCLCSTGHHLRKQIQQQPHHSGGRKKAMCQWGFSPATSCDLLRLHQRLCPSSLAPVLVLEPETHIQLLILLSLFQKASLPVSVQWFLTPLARISSSDSQRLQPRNRKEDDKPGLLRWFLWLNHLIISWKPSLSTQKQFSELKTTAIDDFTYHLWAPWPFTWEFILARVLLALLSMMLLQMTNCTILMFRIPEQRWPFSPFLSFTANTISLSVQRDAVQDSSKQWHYCCSAARAAESPAELTARQGWAEPPMGHYEPWNSIAQHCK